MDKFIEAGALSENNSKIEAPASIPINNFQLYFIIDDSADLKPF